MERVRVKSGTIRAIGYDEAEQILEIQFVHGGIYHYFGVSKKIYDSLMRAPPAYGTYHARYIKNRYRHKKIA
ncbi:MAG TPA: KTSC domain-containing protein [Nitrosopumilaceae archaeon]|nr:KTSC domain-containing protein [Nitrosopumilaceae archaeon]